jgi:hypothetical protein
MFASRPSFVLVLTLVLSSLLSSVSAVAQVSGEHGESGTPGWLEFVEPALRGGEEGMVFFPAVRSGGKVVEVLDPRGFEVRMTDADDPGEERVWMAGEVFLPPAGRQRIWLQGEAGMSSSSDLIGFGPTWNWGKTRPHYMQVVPSGRVRLDAEAAASGDELWLLSVGSQAEGWFELSRRRPAAEAAEGVWMPEGPVLAGLWDPGGERLVALSRPFEVAAGETVTAPLRTPAEGAGDLLLYARESREVTQESFADVEPVVERGGERRAPARTFETAWGLYAAWYGLAAGPAVLSGGGDRVYLEPHTVELEGGTAQRVEMPLLRRPLLDVNLVLPALLREESFTLTVRKLPDGEELAKVELREDAGRHRFERLVAGQLEVVLDTHVGVFRRPIELEPAEEGFLLLQPEVIELWGIVSRGGEPHPATVEFQTTAGDSVEAVAGEEGGYRTLSLQPIRSSRVALTGVDQEPWIEIYFSPLRTSQELDFDVPDVEWTVRVLDSVSRQPVVGARLAVRNEYLRPLRPDEEEVSEESRWSAQSRSYEADGDGVARPAPPRPGRVEITAHAEGYQKMAEPLVVEAADPPRDRELELLLQPYGETVAVRLTLADGSPAAGAEVLRAASADLRETWFGGAADAAGVVQVPVEPPGGLLLIRHPAAASAVVDWPARRVEEPLAWTLAPVAELPLSLRVRDPSGEAPARQAPIALFIDGRRLAGAALHWLFGARPYADNFGLWTGSGLPRTPLSALAYHRDLHRELEAGGLDTLAAPVPYPWPAEVELRAVR